jgi:hypothetical protein
MLAHKASKKNALGLYASALKRHSRTRNPRQSKQNAAPLSQRIPPHPRFHAGSQFGKTYPLQVEQQDSCRYTAGTKGEPTKKADGKKSKEEIDI